MDSLTDALAGSSFSVGTDKNSIYSPHPRFSRYYKNRGDFGDQTERRNKLLKQQKDRRFDFTSHVRNLGEGSVTTNKDEEDMEAETSGHRKPGKSYKNQLMFSEWMVDVPDDFDDSWMMVPCPVGKRTFVIASKGGTKSFSKGGFRMNQFPSQLPGGNKYKPNDTTILDCIYCEKDRTYWIQDMMCWKSHPIYDTETEFRFYWINSKFEETPEVKTISKLNPFKFLPLSQVLCARENLQKTMETPFSFELDGLLFFHKNCHYNFGSTPLVVWLKAYMMPEVLGVQVPAKYISQQPTDYASHQNFMESVDKAGYAKTAQHHRKSPGKKKSKSSSDVMEVETKSSDNISDQQSTCKSHKEKPNKSSDSVNVEMECASVPSEKTQHDTKET